MCKFNEIFVDHVDQGLVNRLGKISDCANDELSPAILYYIVLCTASRLAVFVTWRKEEEKKLSHP